MFKFIVKQEGNAERKWILPQGSFAEEFVEKEKKARRSRGKKWKRGNKIRRRGQKILRRKNVIWNFFLKTRKRIKKTRRRRK